MRRCGDRTVEARSRIQVVKNRKFRILFGGMSVMTDIPLYNARFFLYIEYMFGIMDL